LQAIKKALNKEIPSSIKIENTLQNVANSSDNKEPDKKMLQIVDKFTDAEKIRLELVHKIQEMKEIVNQYGTRQ
jgi:hypothetical protein